MFFAIYALISFWKLKDIFKINFFVLHNIKNIKRYTGKFKYKGKSYHINSINSSTIKYTIFLAIIIMKIIKLYSLTVTVDAIFFPPEVGATPSDWLTDDLRPKINYKIIIITKIHTVT